MVAIFTIRFLPGYRMYNLVYILVGILYMILNRLSSAMNIFAIY